MLKLTADSGTDDRDDERHGDLSLTKRVLDQLSYISSNSLSATSAAFL
jgi:hypothetical protein